MKNNFDRRRFLLGVAPVATVALGLKGLAKESTVKPSYYAPTFFSAAEWSFLNAAVGRLTSLRQELGASHPRPKAYRELAERIRSSFDPNNILNPGKLATAVPGAA